VKLKWDLAEERLVMVRKGKRVGDIEQCPLGTFAVLHYRTDLSWEVDGLANAVQLLLDTDDEWGASK
jgi:hypothetical protein